MYRLFCLRSLLPENQERTFGDLRSISVRTSNRQAKYVVDNCVLRFLAKQDSEDQIDSFEHQDSAISQQARLLPPRGNSIIPGQLIASRHRLIQAHCQRISDFLEVGINVWWKTSEGHVEFLDGPHENHSQDCGPNLHHFSTSNLKKEYAYLDEKWKNIIDKVTTNKFTVPCMKIKVYDVNGKVTSVLNTNLDLEKKFR
ncbi:unnamed protein product [Mytilus edulis]|uniref:Uncharacterized protein n=1 Tax=Mytilus edulis TaxID=6550 RepID=A0A8S3QLC9_MYTED|nr:unnamed protein product [Mytilus edulis]